MKTLIRALTVMLVAGGSALTIAATTTPAAAYCNYSGCYGYHSHQYHSYHQYNGY